VYTKLPKANVGLFEYNVITATVSRQAKALFSVPTENPAE
jgi:hypothetical protein